VRVTVSLAPVAESPRFLRRHRTVVTAWLVAVVAVGAFLAVRSADDRSEPDAVLDEPGEYQEPAIAVNDDIVGEPLPSVDVVTVGGAEIDVRDLLDGRPLILNVWFSNCQPCKREMPALQAAHAAHSGNIRFVGVNPQDSETRMLSFADDLGVDYELVRDPDGRFVTATGVATYPATFAVDAEGNIIAQIAGELSDNEITRLMETLEQT